MPMHASSNAKPAKIDSRNVYARGCAALGRHPLLHGTYAEDRLICIQFFYLLPKQLRRFQFIAAGLDHHRHRAPQRWRRREIHGCIRLLRRIVIARVSHYSDDP